MEGFSSGEILGLELDVMPQIEDELLEIDNLANLIAEGHFVLFLGKDVNAEIKDLIIPGQTIGQVVGFLGPSGIGKTKLFDYILIAKK